MAYSVASMSWLTRRRFDLGIGAGNFQHEFDVIGQADVKRPELMKEQALIARRLWTGETRRVAQRAVRLRRRRPQAAAGPSGAGLVGRGDAGLGPPGGRLLRRLAARPDHVPDLRGPGRQDPRADRRAGQADDHDRRRAGDEHRRLVRGRDRPDERARASSRTPTPRSSGSSRRAASSRRSRSWTARSWPARRTTSCAASSATRRSAATCSSSTSGCASTDWLEQIEILAREVLPRVTEPTTVGA